MDHETLRVLTQKELQRGADMITEGSEIVRRASDNLSQLRCVDEPITLPEPTPVTSSLDVFDLSRGDTPEAWFKNLIWFNDPTTVRREGDLLVQRFIPSSKGTVRSHGAALVPRGMTKLGVRFDVLFPSNWEWVRGGKFGFGFYAGLAETRRREDGSTYTHTSGGGNNHPDASIIRPIFRPGGRLHVYTYRQNKVDPSYRYGEDLAGGQVVPVGQWSSITLVAYLNSQLDKADGELHFTVNGETNVLRGIQFLSEGILDFTRAVISAFHGGGDSTWSPSKPLVLRYRNIEYFMPS